MRIVVVMYCLGNNDKDKDLGFKDVGEARE
jgi:hypothetical protein